MKTSIVIPTYNRAKELDRLLRSLEPFNADEILIIDSFSTDETGGIVAQHQLHDRAIRFLKIDEKGIPNARNYGVHQARGDVVIFVDSDMTIEGTNWLNSLILPLRKKGLGMSFGRVLTANRTFTQRYAKAGGGLGMLDFGDKPFEVTNDNFVTFPMGNVAIKKEVFEIVGEFDVNLKVGEDNDFCRRAIKHFKFAHVPSALAIHNHRSTISSLIKHGFSTGYLDTTLRKKYKKSKFDERYTPKVLAVHSLVPFLIIYGLMWLFQPLVALVLTVIGYSFLIFFKYSFPLPADNKGEVLVFPFIDVFYYTAYSIGWWLSLVKRKNGVNHS